MVVTEVEEATVVAVVDAVDTLAVAIGGVATMTVVAVWFSHRDVYIFAPAAPCS